MAKPTFHRFGIFNEGMVGIHLLQLDLKLNKPIQIGFTILDLSKTLMYESHYIKKKYPEAKLIFTDTDSVCYDITTEDIYKDMEQDAHLFNTSNYLKDHFLHSTLNKKVLGKMKEETAGVPIEEFVELRPKIYCLLYGGKKKRTAKGITRANQSQMKHEQYKTSLFKGKPTCVVGHIIRSHDHKLYSEKVKKMALSLFDDKCCVLNDGVTTLAHGHYSAYKTCHSEPVHIQFNN